MPVFSSFVHQLRAKGHRARVRARPLPSAGATESIELRITVQASDHYRPSGNVSISMLEHSLGGWKTEISPEAEQGSAHAGGRTAQRPAVNAHTTKEQLEAIVLSVVERLCAR